MKYVLIISIRIYIILAYSPYSIDQIINSKLLAHVFDAVHLGHGTPRSVRLQSDQISKNKALNITVVIVLQKMLALA